MRHILILLMIGLFSVSCSMPLPPPPPAPFSQYPVNPPRNPVQNYPSYPTQADESVKMQGMTYAHNRVRAILGLPALTWSGAIAGYAQEWAQFLANNYACKMEHRTNLKRDAKGYGENIFWASATSWSNGYLAPQNISASEVVASWASEVSDYSYARNSCRRGKQCGHYTQIVWRTTRQLGCGMAYCPGQGQIWVCSYDPAGNWVGEYPY